MQGYSLVAGDGLGTRYTSLTQQGLLRPLEKVGQAKVSFISNVSNGNLFVTDYATLMQASNGAIALGYVYNSLAPLENAWHFSLDKRWTQLPQNKTQNAVLLEGDGHVSQYVYDTKTDSYLAPAHAEGRASLRYDAASKQWSWVHPKTKISEFYDQAGLLRKHQDAKGRSTRYEYNDAKQLSAIIGPSGERYELQRSANQVQLWVVNDTVKQLLQSYYFDQHNRLQKSELPDGYSINYSYDASSGMLTGVEQTDGSKASFGYNQKRLTELKLGDNTSSIDYQQPDKVVVTSAAGNTTLELDHKQRLSRLSLPNAQGKMDVSSYAYSDEGYLASIVHPDKNQEQFAYTDGLLTEHILPTGQKLTCYYQQGWLQTEVIVNNNKPAVNRYVYDKNCNGHYFLRFSISAMGRVIEYRPNDQGNIASERQYLDKLFDITGLAPDAVPELSSMEQWASQQAQDKVSLSYYQYDSYGQISLKQSFAHVDTSGQGIVDESMGQEAFVKDRHGNILQHKVKQQGQTQASTLQQFDSLQRPITVIDALEQASDYQYKANLLQVTLPNGRQTMQQLDSAGLVQAVEQRVQVGDEQQTRLTRYERDQAGRIIVSHLPDGREIYTFYDGQDRLSHKVSTSGLVEEIQQHSEHNYISKTLYALPIEMAKLRPDSKQLPTLATLQSLLIKQPAKDRTEYEFLDAVGHVRYKVDAAQYVVEYRYDAVGNKLAEIAYATKLDAAKLEQLKQGQAIELPFAAEQDRCQRFFYDVDNLLIGKQDAAGYVVEYLRNAAGWITHSIRYATHQAVEAVAQDFAELRPKPSPEDAHRYFFHDNKGQVILEVDAEGYVTTHAYLACGLKSSSLRYQNKVNADWYSHCADMPTLPEAHINDELHTHQYDRLEREVAATLPLQQGVYKNYDAMGHVTLCHKIDLNDPRSSDSSKQRSQQTCFDSWEQVSSEANPYLAQALLEIDADSTLDEQQKAAKKTELWQKQGVHHAYDASGLKCHSQDIMGKTFYFYDQERRLVLIIAPDGRMTETQYNSFHEPELLRRYDISLPQDRLGQLSGGFMFDELHAYLNANKNDAKDLLTRLETDKRGQVVQTIDPEGYVATKEYNAFKECEREGLSVEGKAPSLFITHRYEGRGLEIATEQQTKDLRLTTTQKYNNPHAKMSQRQDAADGNTVFKHDRLGREVIVSKTVEAAGKSVTEEKHYDASHRLVKEIDALGNHLNHEFNDKQRTHTILEETTGSKQTVYNNIFGQALQKTDGLGQQDSWSYAPDGQETLYTDKLSHQRVSLYNTKGWLLNQTNAKGIVDQYAYNLVGELILKTEDCQGVAAKTAFIRNNFGWAVETKDPRGVRTQMTHDKRGRVTSELYDPSTEQYQGLDLLQSYTYNGQDSKTSYTQGDKHNPVQFHKVFTKDSLGRDAGDCIDPDGLCLSRLKQRDGMGKIVKETDANGNAQYFYYNLLGQKRLHVDAAGGVMEWSYYDDGKLASERKYEQGVDPKLLDEKTAIAKLVKTSAQDGLLYHFYDTNGQECFTVNGLGYVIQNTYDLAAHHTATIKYSNKLDSTTLASLTTAKLQQQIKLIADPAHDRATHFIHDAKGQVRFTIDPEGYVVEKCYNNLGQVIAETGCANKLEPQDFASLTQAKLSEIIIPNPEQDRTSYYLFDDRKNPSFTVNAAGAVIRLRYDLANQLQEECQFANLIVLPDSYEKLAVLLNGLIADPKVDRITHYERDAAKRLVKVTDPQGNSDSFKLSALGDTELHTDRNGNEWVYKYDAAKRLVKEVKPKSVVSLVTPVENRSDWRLQLNQQEIAVETTKIYDANGNLIELQEASNTAEKRTTKMAYSLLNKRSHTSSTATIDDASKPADISQRPEQIVDLQSANQFNAKGLEVVVQDESGAKRFKVYDSEQQLLYTVDQAKGVIKTERNAFGEVIKETRYANVLDILDIDLESYSSSGIPLEIVEQALKPSPEDRTFTMARDRRGDILVEQKDEVFCYEMNADGNCDGGLLIPTTQWKYNAFREHTYEAKLVNPKQGENGIWSICLWWYSKTGKVIAESNPLWNFKRYSLNAFDEITERKEYANPLTAYAEGKTLAEVEQLVQPSPTDRTYTFGYNLLGLKVSETQAAVKVQTLTIDDKLMPSLQDMVVNITTTYGFNAVGQQTSLRYDDGSCEYMSYHPCGQLWAKSEVTRFSYDEHDQAVWLTPLTQFGYNAHGEQVMSVRFKQGAKPEALLNPIAIDAEDQYNLIQRNNLGLAIVEQDGEGNNFYKTYTAGRRLARQYHLSSNWQLGQTWQQNTLLYNMDETRNTCDAKGRCVLTVKMRDGQILHTTQTQFNSFDQPILQGLGDNTYSVYWRYDNNGFCWSSNAEQGIATVRYPSMQGKVTLEAVSAGHDLSSLAYSQLSELLNYPIGEVDWTRNQRDLAGRVVLHFTPYYYQNDNWIFPASRRVYDAWDNTVQLYDFNGYEWLYEFNALNKQITLIKPEVQAMLPDGNVQALRPCECYAYNVRGFEIGAITGGSIDANRIATGGIITGYALNQNGDLLHQVRAGELEVAKVWDVLGRVVREKDGRWLSWHKQYNRNNKLVGLTTPMGRQSWFRYNELNERNQAINPAGYARGYSYDVNSNIAWRIQPDNRTYGMLHDRNHQLLRLTNPDGSVQAIQRNYFGYDEEICDISNALTKKKYNHAMQLIEQTTEGNERHGNMLQLANVYKEKDHFISDRHFFEAESWLYSLKIVQPYNQLLNFSYSGGRLMQVQDKAMGHIFDYAEDSMGNRTQMRISDANKQCFYDARTELDAIGREFRSLVYQGDQLLDYNCKYDLVDNRRLEATWLTYSNNISIGSKENWFAYDACNRVIRQGIGWYDISFAYAGGLRSWEKYKFRGTEIEPLPYFLNYNADGFLSSVEVEYFAQKDRRKEKKIRTTIRELDYHPEGWLTQVTSLSQLINKHRHFGWFKKLICNENGWPLLEKSMGFETEYTSYSPMGVALTQTEKGSFWQKDDSGGDEQIQYTDYLTNHYVGIGNELRISQVDGKRVQSNGKTLDNHAYLLYDVNGNAGGIVRWNHPSYMYYKDHPFHRLELLPTSYDGFIITKANFDAHGNNGYEFWPTRDNAWQNYFCNAQRKYLGGVKLNNVSANIFSHDPSDWMRRKNDEYKCIDGAWDNYHAYAEQHKDYSTCMTSNDMRGVVKFPDNRVLTWGDVVTRSLEVPEISKPMAADLNFELEFQIKTNQTEDTNSYGNPGYSTFSFTHTEFAPKAPQYYVVQPGDTMAKIASNLKKTSRLAEAIARENGLSVYDSLKPGYELFIPDLPCYYNSSQDSVPYSQVHTAIIGSIRPYLVIIPPPPHPHHSIWGSFLAIVIPIVVGIFLGPAGMCLMQTLSGAIVAGAVNSFVTQVTLIGLGYQDQMSMLGILEGAVMGAVGANLGALNNISAEVLAKRLVTNCIVYASEEVGKEMLGVESNFTVGGMLSYAVAQTANAYLAGQYKGNGTMNRMLLTEEQILVSNASQWALTGQKFNVADLVGQLAGAATGTLIEGSVMAQKNKEYERAQQTSKAHQAAEQASQGKSIVSEQVKTQSRRGYGFFDPGPDIASPKMPSVKEDDFMQANRGIAWQHEHIVSQGPVVSNQGKVQQNNKSATNLALRLKDNFTGEIQDLNTTIGATLEHFGEQIGQRGLVEKYSRYNLFAKNSAVRVAENINDIAKSQAMYQRYSKLAAKYGLYTMGTELIEGAAKLVLPVEILQGAMNVLRAETGTKLQTSFEETGKIVGSALGGTVGVLVASGEEAASFGMLTPVAIGTTVLFSSAGAALGKEFGQFMYTEISDGPELYENDMRNRY
jgi:YD repeat-containing protein